MIQTIEFVRGDRQIAFSLDLVDDFTADQNVRWHIERQQVPEPEVVNFMLSVVREGDLVVDAGANVGLFTLLLSSLVGESGKVVAIEPDPRNVKKLERNIEINERKNVRIVPYALWYETTSIQFLLSDDSGESCQTKTYSIKTTLMPTMVLDKLLPDETPRLIKMDIEGAEVKAWRGATQLLLRQPPFIICETNVEALNRQGNEVRDLRHVLWNYDMFVLPENAGLPALVPPKSRVVPTRANANILFSTVDEIGKAWSEVQT